MAFELDQRLQQDTHLMGENEQALLLLMNDSRYPWFIVVPRQANTVEWFDLPEPVQLRLHQDCVALGRCLQAAFDCDKINIAALGNVVRQMHVHVIGRYQHDPAWPGPVWGHSPATAYSGADLAMRRERLLGQNDLPFTLL